MDSKSTRIPEEYVDMLLQEFTYDPIRLPLAEDPAQVFYNRRTLDTIWDAKHDALNPFTRQPLHISHAIPQSELRQQMHQYIVDITSPKKISRLQLPKWIRKVLESPKSLLMIQFVYPLWKTLLRCSTTAGHWKLFGMPNTMQQMHQYIVDNNSPTLRLEVIPDYTKVLSQKKMKNLLKQLILDYECLVNQHCIKGNLEIERYWKVFWQRLNIVRLYCQYRKENRERFSAIRGYTYLSQIINERLFNLCDEYYSLCDDTKEVCKEVARIVDVVGFRNCELLILRKEFLWALVRILSVLAARCDHLKIQRMVLRFYRRMFHDCSIVCNKKFCSCIVEISLDVLGRENFRDICNEDLYNGMAVLKSAWIRNKKTCVAKFDYDDIIVNVVNICISRFQDMHAAAIADRANPEDDEEEKNISLIGIALHRGLWLINSLLTATPRDGEGEFFSRFKVKLQNSDIGGVIVRMVELVLAGFKNLRSSHLRSGIKIAAILYKEEASGRRNEVLRVFEDFLGSQIVDEFDTVVKLSLKDIVDDFKSEASRSGDDLNGPFASLKNTPSLNTSLYL